MLDPFGREAKAIVKELGGIEALLDRIALYVDIDSAMKRVEWMKDGEVPPSVINMSDNEDVLTFYALLGALAFSPYGLEMELVRKANLQIYRERWKREKGALKISLPVVPVKGDEIPERDRIILEKPLHDEIGEENRRQLKLGYKVRLSTFLHLWERSLKDVYIRRGYAYLTRPQVQELWERAFERNFERSVNLLYDMRDDLPEYYRRLYERLSEVSREIFKEKLERMGSVEARPLRLELFPPCVKEALHGVTSGLRNYAITVLLTSFLSYARICPNPPRRGIRIKDCINDLDVLEKEILPLIIEAGNRCVPPFFEDQPAEIKNIWYHLGFGMTDKPSIEDSGNSTWYFPPNCSKIRANAPGLCKPDRNCRNIKNPLTYYLRRLYIEGRKAEGSKENTGEGEQNG